jgi:predicted phage-related endonuclease
MHQLAVTGKQAADVAVLVCGNDFRVYRIERDEAMIANLIRLEKNFWHYVQTDTPPPADGSESSGQALRHLFPRDAGTVVDFSADRELCATYADWVSLREVLARQEALEAQLAQRMQQAMGEATQAKFETGSVRWKKTADSNVLDAASLLKDDPTLLQRYGKVRNGPRRFTNVETKS